METGERQPGRSSLSAIDASGHRRRLSHSGSQESALGQEFSLPPADGGRQAWLFLAGCFMIEALVWGFPFCFGLFEEYYTTHEPFSSHASGVAIIGTTSTGIMYLIGPPIFWFYQRWPQHRRGSLFLGLPIMTTSLIASSFVTTVPLLILTQGVLYGLGGALLYCPTYLFLEEWFVRNRGFAIGIMWAGTGTSGVTVPFLMSWSLEKYGSSITLRAWAIGVTVLIGPLLLFLKPRIPLAPAHRRPQFDVRFLGAPVFWILQTCNILEGLGYFLPSIYLPLYAQAVGMSRSSGTLTLALLNGGAVIGSIGTGTLVDRLHVTTVTFALTIGASLAVFLLWGFALSLPTLAVFSVLYGLTAGAFSTTWTGIIREVQKRETGTNPALCFGFLTAGRGIGAVLSGPLSGVLLSSDAWRGAATGAYGTHYGSLVVFTGTTAVLGGASFMARRIGWI
ncbi:hypothetical protein MMC25_003377 [Agyrium rufum]|nr:hypothetical protein [Agyrium rufum]